jgi:hypothetical protein
MGDDPVQQAIDIGYLLVIALLAYVGWKIYDSFAGTTADNGQKKCTLSDMSNGNCVSGSGGGVCGWFEYLTATSCYEGTPSTPPAAASDSSPSTSQLIGSIFTSSGTPAAPSPAGVPAGCDLTTGIGC